MKKLHFLLLCMFAGITVTCSGPRPKSVNSKDAYRPASPELHAAISHMDSVLFSAFNNRDLEKQKEIFALDLEFYHDKGGLTNYNQTIENTRRLFGQNNGLKRELVPGTLRVYPINGYGALQTGEHRFCHQENGKDDCGTFKFVHIWQKRANDWKLTRVISYDH